MDRRITNGAFGVIDQDLVLAGFDVQLAESPALAIEHLVLIIRVVSKIRVPMAIIAVGPHGKDDFLHAVPAKLLLDRFGDHGRCGRRGLALRPDGLCQELLDLGIWERQLPYGEELMTTRPQAKNAKVAAFALEILELLDPTFAVFLVKQGDPLLVFACRLQLVLDRIRSFPGDLELIDRDDFAKIEFKLACIPFLTGPAGRRVAIDRVNRSIGAWMNGCRRDSRFRFGRKAMRGDECEQYQQHGLLV